MRRTNRGLTASGLVEGVTSPTSGIRSFRGIPFAAPPVSDLRCKPPQPEQPWEGVRKADRFGPRAMQRPMFGDMNFRSNGMSGDCLYLNVWTPAQSDQERLPVLVCFTPDIRAHCQSTNRLLVTSGHGPCPHTDSG